MARCECQNIPADLLEAYVAALEPASEFKTTGKNGKIMPERIRKRYPFQLEPPHVATAGQLEVRHWFKEGINCFNQTTPQERSAWFGAAQDSGLFYYDYYLSQIIPRLRAGETCEDTQRPDAMSFRSFDGLKCAYIMQRVYDEAHNSWFTYEIERDPAYPIGCVLPPHHVPSVWGIHVIAQYWDHLAHPPFWATLWVRTLAGFTRETFVGYLPVGAVYRPHRRVYLQVNGLTTNYCVAWKFHFNVPVVEQELYNFI